jgi:glycosyltransferase involved in cell wall biosynthesis
MQTLDIVTSTRNEVFNLPLLVESIFETMKTENYSWRLIVSDNSSTDGTWERIISLSNSYPNIIGLRLSKDFGFEASLTAALSQSDADLVLMMASDLQDAPPFIPKFLRKYEEGFDHVYQIVEKRPGVSRLRNLNSQIFYWFAEKFSDGTIQRNSSTYRLITGEVRDSLMQLEESNRFIRALVSWVGYNSVGIPLPRSERVKGKSKATTKAVFSYALKGIMANSTALLDFVGILGLVISVISFTATFTFSAIWILHGVPYAGFGTIAGTIFLGFGLIFLCLGVIAQYLSLVYQEVKNRPNFIIREKCINGKPKL